MKKLIFTSVAVVLIQSLLFSQNAGFTINGTGDFFQNGKKIGRVVKTTNSNIMTGAIPEFTVYDVNNVPRFLFEKTEGKFIFLDDNKSFLPRIVDAYAKQVAKFFASDSILTPRGYNVAYRSMFIRKHKGYDFSEKKDRDYNAPVSYIEKSILQGDVVIGSYDYRLMDVSKDVHVAVSDLNNRKVAFITVMKEANSVAYVTMEIVDANQKEVKVFEKEFDTGGLYKKGIEWIVQNGFLGTKPTEAKSTILITAEKSPLEKTPIPEVEIPTRFLEVKDPALVEPTQNSTMVATVNRSGDMLALSKSGSWRGDHALGSVIIDLNSGRVATKDSMAVRYIDDFTVMTDLSTVNKGDPNARICVKVEGKTGLNCFAKPPEGFMYTGVISEKYLLGIEIKDGLDKVLLFHNVGNETEVKFKFDVSQYNVRSTPDGKGVYGLYTFSTTDWTEFNNISQERLVFAKKEPSNKNSSEYKAYEKEKVAFEKRINKREIALESIKGKSPDIYYGLRIYNLETGILEKEINFPDYVQYARNAHMLADGRIFIRYSNFDKTQGKLIGKANIYSADGSQILVKMEGLNADPLLPINTLVAYKTKHAVSIFSDGLIKVFDINTGKLVNQFQNSAPAGEKLPQTTVPIYLPIKEGYVLIPRKNGLINLFSIKEMKVIANLFITKNDWAMITNDGRFDGSLTVAERPKFRMLFGKKDLELLIELFDYYGEIIQVTSKDYLLTGDDDLLDFREFEGTKISKISDYLKNTS